MIRFSLDIKPITYTLYPHQVKQMNAWIEKMTKAMLSVIGLIIGFNCYYIIVLSKYHCRLEKML